MAGVTAVDTTSMTRVITIQMTETRTGFVDKKYDENCVRSFFKNMFQPDQLNITIQDFDHTPEYGEYKEVDITQQVMEVDA